MHFDDRVITFGTHGAMQKPLKVGVARHRISNLIFLAFIADLYAQRRDKRRALSGALQNGVDQFKCRRLAFCARHADHEKFFARIAMQICAGPCP